MSEKFRTCQSNCRDPKNRSKKDCVCGGHSRKAIKKKKKYTRDSIRKKCQ